MKINISKYIVLLLILGGFIFSAPTSVAAKTANLPIKQILKVSPIIIDTTLKKGPNNYSIEVQNLLDEAIGINANVQNFDPENQSIIVKNPLVDWTTINSPSILIEPKQTKTISITINVLQNAKDSGYSEFVFLTPVFLKNQAPASPTVLERVGVLVLTNLGKINYDQLAAKTSIENFRTANLFYDKLPAILNFTVKNSYFNHFTAKPFLSVTPLFGKPETVVLEEKHVLPGQERNWTQVLAPKAKSFFYTLNLAVSIGNGKQIFANSYFFVFPIKKALISIIILLTIILVLIRKRQIKKALRILIKGEL